MSMKRMGKAMVAVVLATVVLGGCFKDGTHTVGTGPDQVAPGTYISGMNGSGCYWARVSGFGGSFDEILANDIGNGQRIVTVVAGDAGIISSHCGPFTEAEKVHNRPDPAVPLPGDGVFRVGIDVAAGRWQAAPSDPSRCYFERMSDFTGGGVDSIIANGFGTIVDISPTDVGFSTSSCGTWTKVG